MKKKKKDLRLYLLISMMVSAVILFPLTLLTAHATDPAQQIQLDGNGYPIASSGTGWEYDAGQKILTLNSAYTFEIIKDSTTPTACACAVVNNGTIAHGSFNGTVANHGVIEGDTFAGIVTNYTGGAVNGGEFSSNIQGTEGTIRVTVYPDHELDQHYSEDVTTGGLPKEPLKQGFIFGGWYGDRDCSTEKVEEVRKPTTLYGKWYKAYTITYELDGGVNGNNPAQYATESDTITLLDASKSGYTFIGWTGNGITNPTPGIKITKGTSGNLTFTAHFQTNATPVPTASEGTHVVTCEEAGFGTGSYWDETTKSCVTPERTPEPTENVFLRATPIPLPTATPTPTSTSPYYTPSTEHTPGATPAPTQVSTPTPTPNGTEQAGSNDLAVANLALGAIAIATGAYAVAASGAAGTTTAAKVIGIAGIGVAAGAFLLTQKLGGNITLVDHSTVWFAGAAAGGVSAALLKASAVNNAIRK